MIFNFITRNHRKSPETLADLQVGERAVVGEFEMEPGTAEHLMNLGLIPGVEVTVAHSGPGGDPRIYRVEGTELALRGELSRCITVEPQSVAAD